MQFIGYGLSDRGLNRPVNEDVVVLDPVLGLWVVCDGMGGHTSGDLAARTAAQTVHNSVAQDYGHLMQETDPNARRAMAVALMRRAALEASRAVYGLALEGAGRPGMGTTLTALLTYRGLGVMAHVGDSRLYLLRAGTIHQLSDDHTIAAEMIKRGGLSREEAFGLNVAKSLSRAVGIQPQVEVDSLVFDILPGDTFLLCSDGLSRYLRGFEEISGYLRTADLTGLPQELVALANRRGGRDNIAVITVRAETGKDWSADDQAQSSEAVLRLETLRHISLFQPLTLKELVHVMNLLSARDCREGEVIVREGDVGDGLYVILTGSVSVTRGGRELALLEAGTHFGEMALLNERPRSATVSARGPTRLVEMNRLAFTDILRHHPEIAVKLLWTFAQVLSLRLDEASENLFNIAPTQQVSRELIQSLEEAIGKDPRKPTRPDE